MCKRRVASCLLALAAAFHGAACFSAPLWLDVPFVPQEPNGCGSASLAMVLDYWDRPADAHAIQQQLYVPAEKGIPAKAMQDYLLRRGFLAIAFRGDWDELSKHLARGRPLIVAFAGGGETLHYAVAAGIRDNAIALNDPADRKLRLVDRARFEKQWKATAYWTLLAVPSEAP